jgi:arylsulfatase A-like enzyme
MRVRLLCGALGLALTAGLLLTSCGREQTVFVQVSDLLPVLDLQVGTGVILPSSDPLTSELGEGWVGRSSSRSDPRTAVRVRSKRAELFIVAAAPGDLEMTFEARALSQPQDGPQTMAIVLGGEPLETIELGTDYETYSLRLPEKILRAGRNRVVLEFAAAGPVVSGGATVMGAARVRNLAIHNSLGRRPAPPRLGDVTEAADIEQSSDGQSTESRSADIPPAEDQDLRMPADSILDLAIEVPENARLTAELIRSLADPDGAEREGSREHPQDPPNDRTPGSPSDIDDLFVSVEVIDSDGMAEVIYEHGFGEGSMFSSSDRSALDISLEDWEREEILLRLRTWGGQNGHVVWGDLRITCDCEAPPPAYMACSLPEVPSSGRLGRPDIFVILLDAARADAFSTYGAARPTPFVDGLATEGTKFTSAFSPSSWTAPTTASLLSGRYPDAHGVEDWDRRLPGSITTVTEMLADAGYYTFLGSHHNVYRGNQPLRRGFEGIELIDQNLRDTLPDPDLMFVPDRPTFALIHLLPPHAPYEPPPPYRGIYAGDSEPVTDVSVDSLRSISRSGTALSDEAVRYVRDRYDENVAYADSLVGRVIAELRARDRYDDAMVILLADHGEAFFEHRDFLHRLTLYGEVLRIPLVIKWPAGTTGYQSVVAAPVSLIDLSPTLADGLGIVDSRASFQGISLIPAIFEGLTPDRGVYATTLPSSQSGRRGRALYRDQMKLILDETGVPRLYDLALDPREQDNKAMAEPVIAQLLSQELLAQRRCNQMLLSGAGQAPQIVLDPEKLRELRALGYIQ